MRPYLPQLPLPQGLALVAVLTLGGCPAGRMPEEDLARPDAGADLQGADLALVAPLAFLDLDTLYMDCPMPAQPDPLLLKGRLTVRNQGGLSLGPVTVAGGTLFDKDDRALATFQLSDPALGTLAPNGAIEGKVVDKAAGSLNPLLDCQALPCNAAVRVELQLAGANLPQGSKAKSASYTVMCK
jgi:hypothetical protein